MPWQPRVHRPPGWQDKKSRDRDYAVHRDRASLALMATPAWRKARLAFLMVNPLCIVCHRAANVVDHRDPHRGNVELFWDRSRWQPMCASCHGRKTATQDGGFGHRRHAGPLRAPWG